MKKDILQITYPRNPSKKMILCFEPQFKSYAAGETILAYSDQLEKKVGILLAGRARLYYIDENGDSSLLENYAKEDLFGEVFSLPLEDYEYIVTAETDCNVVFISYQHIVTPCEKSCQHHSQLISNLFSHDSAEIPSAVTAYHHPQSAHHQKKAAGLFKICPILLRCQGGRIF